MNFLTSGSATTIAIGALAVFVFLVLLRFAQKNYVKVPPHTLAVVSGRKLRFVRGGATLVIPLLERLDTLDLRTIVIPNLMVKDAITKEGVELTVKAVANIKVGSTDTLARAAMERLLGKNQDEIKSLAYESLEGHLRSMLGTLTVGEVNNDRAAFSQKMISESQQDLAKIGLEIDVLTVKELSDTKGYLTALGEKRTAEVKRDATIGRAEADAEAEKKSTTAKREGEVTKQGNLAQEAEAEAGKNIKVAQYRAATETEKAKADQAGPLATAEARKAVVEREQEVELVRTQKATEVARAQAAKVEQELNATVVKQAEAKKSAAIAEAEGAARAVQIAADAERAKRIAEGEGEAAAIRLKGEAAAAATLATLLAEAEGVLKKANAYKELNQAGRLLQILEASQKLVPNALAAFAQVMGATAAPLGQADKIIVMDNGSGNGHGSALDRYAGIAPNLVFGLIERAKGAGLDLTGLLAKAGIVEEGNGSK